MDTRTQIAEPSPSDPAPPAVPDEPQAVRETLEDYTLRFAPRSYRRWTPMVVATTALGGIAYMADFSIGAGIAMAHGTGNALVAITVAAALIFITGFPLAYYAARYNIDLDLITRGSGFGYYGSVLTGVIFASFTVIFFALEGAIMAQGLKLGFGLPLWLGYAVSTLMVIPLVIYGMKALSKLQVWTTPIWLLLMVGPLVYLVATDPGTVDSFLAYAGTDGEGSLNTASVLLGAGVCLSLIAQIGEQIDYLRFMPPKTEANRRSWWTAMVMAGPGWVVLGAIKQAIGVFLAVYILSEVGPAAATEPIQQFRGAFDAMMPSWLVVPLAVVLVVISQIKINVTNAYSGSLAWTNSFTRVTKHYPGRMIFVLVNLAFALILMEADMFSFLNSILGFYSNCAIAWVVTVATDIGVNKYLLKLSPHAPEFRRGMLHAVNPVGVTAFTAASGLSIAMYFHAFGDTVQPYSPVAAVVIAFVLTPVMAIVTRGRYYLRRGDDGIPVPLLDAEGNPSAVTYDCHVCRQTFERPDLAACPAHDAMVCSLCLSTDKAGDHVLPAAPPVPLSGT
ncbi:purine-cytosine permease family protein [Streptomyces globisporus]|uniref:purine-cytosine permease family protein n=1 Tax=Streptomyces TaxID=1883 RepID=UPI0005C953EF|nr:MULTISPECIES: allantoin permease [Streptomyces]PPA38972.1 allantoin permease [Streptomyces griseus]RAN16377.1 allantoin permease [Streptomyces badius]AWL85179.1 allantoin permease [Streptomyces globisporus]RAN24233.1 allantoin permease [Streptomyces badius]WSF75517.1 allantoin permease [Streptomyces globisporus]